MATDTYHLPIDNNHRIRKDIKTIKDGFSDALVRDLIKSNKETKEMVKELSKRLNAVSKQNLKLVETMSALVKEMQKLKHSQVFPAAQQRRISSSGVPFVYQ